MTSTLVKICGITNLNDALDAIELGADYLGFNFYPDSPRYIPEDQAYEILQEIPTNIPKVGVFVNRDISEAIDIAIDLELDALQFHGDESPDELNPIGRPWYKAFRLREENDLLQIPQYECDMILVDAYSERAYGGTGVVAHWDLVKQAKQFQKKIILAGGLNPDNVEIAIATVQPWMVDVASGVEFEPGRKDRHKMEIFIQKAKKAFLKVL